MSEGSHWYTRDGKPCHTQPTKAGAANPTRGTNIADARRLKLLPSVSGITSVMSNPALERWKMESVAIAAFNCPAQGDEGQEDYVKHVVNAAGEQTRGAADLGTAIHAILEDPAGVPPCLTVTFPTNGQIVAATNILAWVEAKLSPLAITSKECECITVNRAEGYAGTTDMAFVQGKRHGILDYKSIKTKKGEPIKRRESHPMQIAAYIAAYWGKESLTPINEKSVGYNVYISTTEPGRVEVREYSYAELLAAWEAFKACLTLWRYKSGYDPRGA